MVFRWASSYRGRLQTGYNPEANPLSQKYEKLKTLLKELFQLDQPDLDFGLYRLNGKRTLSRIGRRGLGETPAAGRRGPRFTNQLE
jgi:hypothetical protein